MVCSAEAPGPIEGFRLVLGKMGWSGLFDGKMEIREVRFFRSLAPITGVLWCFFLVYLCIWKFRSSGFIYAHIKATAMRMCTRKNGSHPLKRRKGKKNPTHQGARSLESNPIWATKA